MHVEDVLRHTDSVYSVSFTYRTRKILTASLDNTIKVWESFDEVWKCTRTFDGPVDFALTVRSSIDDLWIICGSKDLALYILNAQTGIVHIMLKGHVNSGECSRSGNEWPAADTATVIGCAVSRQGAYFATASGDMKMKLWKYRYLESSWTIDEVN
jgi:WD40 repeat protein